MIILARLWLFSKFSSDAVEFNGEVFDRETKKELDNWFLVRV